MKIALFSQEFNDEVKSIFDKIINNEFSENFAFFLHKDLNIEGLDFSNKSYFKYSKANDLKDEVDLLIIDNSNINGVRIRIPPTGDGTPSKKLFFQS